jgi:hypothetical protein
MKEKSSFDYRAIQVKVLLEQQKYLKLYEGLIQTYSVADTIKGLDLLNKKYDLNVNYSFIESEANKALPYIKILLKKDSLDSRERIVNFFRTCGWYLIDILDKDGVSFKNSIDSYQEIDSILYFIFRAKFDIEIEEKKWPKFLYHVTPYVFLDKIMKIGLVPKSLSKLVKHEDHIYMYDDLTEEKLETLVFNLHISRSLVKFEKYPNKYALLKIDLSKQSGIRLYAGPDLDNGFFTLIRSR